MVTILVAILIVYGITNIIVNGKIFEGVREFFENRVTFYRDAIDFANDEGGELPDVRIFKRKDRKDVIETLNRIEDCKVKLEEDDQPHEEILVATIRSASNVLKQMTEKRIPALERKRYWYLKVFNLINCMMCASFWIGIFLAIVTSIFTINLFGVTFTLVTATGWLSWAVGVFLMGGLFSGTTWLFACVAGFLGDGDTPSRDIYNYEPSGGE